tara:strand:- start:3182 stop:3328 length:147 start_codon:yes stop_codon:yes gene_type:complete
MLNILDMSDFAILFIGTHGQYENLTYKNSTCDVAKISATDCGATAVSW